MPDIEFSDSRLGNPLRRRLLKAGAAIGAWIIVSPALSASEDLTTAISHYTGGAAALPGRVKLDVAALVDNGNTVPITITVDSPMTASEHVTKIAMFNEKNPQRDVIRFSLGPRAGKAEVSSRIRLATSQKLVAIAQTSDGRFWSDSIDVIVTLAACIEGDV
ncbi:SoxY-related AACIE arm protein [Undibacterium sp.]|jgi:sulfur-oxidizing protein SoxY|uniref:SoxY-related AACIE arm protein n=1 Tax=Undibacterium sp. TaxID=1914977 RepID=UPI002B733548|nr:SoxY-related AACIE arm protein [Undibacterium sp.]HTD03509.1 SoxY-related AACIE arm protein [Undibacterium sp.]